MFHWFEFKAAPWNFFMELQQRADESGAAYCLKELVQHEREQSETLHIFVQYQVHPEQLTNRACKQQIVSSGLCAIKRFVAFPLTEWTGQRQ